MKWLVATLFLIAIPAFAQQSQPLDQRIALQLGTLVIQNTSQGVQIEQLQAALTAAQARVKSMEDKYEPKAGQQETK